MLPYQHVIRQSARSDWRFPNFTLDCRTFATPCAVLEKLRRLMFSLPLHCFALFNHNQETPFCNFWSGLRPIYATQSHPQTLLSTYPKSLSGAKLRSVSGSPNARSSITNRKWIFTYRKMKITTSPFVYRGVAVFMPEKLGNLQAHSEISCLSVKRHLRSWSRLEA